MIRRIENRNKKFRGQGPDGWHKLRKLAMGPSGREKEIWSASGHLRPKESGNEPLCPPVRKLTVCLSAFIQGCV